MPRLLGIDIRPTLVRAALLRTSYRRVYLEGLNEVHRAHFETLEEAIRAVAADYAQHHEAISIAFEGSEAYVHRLALPPAALKRVDDVLPFELEAQVPVDFDELVFDSRVLPREKGEARIDVLAAAARTSDVEALIRLTERALGHEPERVGVGPVTLGNLAQLSPEIRAQKAVALIDIGDQVSELVMLVSGTTSFARTLSVGFAGLPGNAPEIVAAIRQSLVAWGSASEHPIETLHFCGGGSELPGMQEYLAAHLGVEVLPLPALGLEGVTEDQRPLLPRYAKAIAVAMGLRAGSKDLDLRRGPLTYQRGFGFLKEKVPLLLGLGAVMLASFVFSAWAESRALTRENAVLASALTTLSKQILDEDTDEVERVIELLDKGAVLEKDPQPEMDGFDLSVALAEHIPKGIEHDVEELDLQRAHVKLRAIVPRAEDAQKIAEGFKQVRCFKEVSISKISQVVKSDRQKYAMEFDVRCEDVKKAPAGKDAEGKEPGAKEEGSKGAAAPEEATE